MCTYLHRERVSDELHAVLPPQSILKIMNLMRKEWSEAVELVGNVKLGLQLSIPPIESGGQFSVGVIEEVSVVAAQATRPLIECLSPMNGVSRVSAARSALDWGGRSGGWSVGMDGMPA